ncbi:MAG: DUF456 domain-containing protein [Dehalococcoidales bacterium]|nr:DUF456 domain-containing protein [Dehalococcoidales bacterium]NLT27529.1 DUF456 domain-containing protein [Dehalococcoidales bacterium]
MEVVFAIICAVLILIGLVGVIMPYLPGVPVAWLGLFIYAIGTDWERLSVTTIVVFGAITVLALLVDFIAPLLGAKKYKASKWGIIGASIGLFLGIIIFQIWGIILGPLLGALIGELIAGKSTDIAFKSALGTFIGFIFGTLMKLVLVLVMAGFFIVSLF